MTTEARARLGAKLATITPGDIDVFFFTNGGAEANENAIKIARAYTGRQKILARYRSYHGGTAAAIAATGEPQAMVAATTSGIRACPRPVSRHSTRLGHNRRRAAPRRGGDSARGSSDDCGVHSGIGDRHERSTGAAGWLHAGRAIALRQVRDPHDRRRGHERVRQDGKVVRHRALGRRAGSAHDGQRADERLRSVGRRRHAAGYCRHVQGQTISRRAHLQQPSSGMRGGAGHSLR